MHRANNNNFISTVDRQLKKFTRINFNLVLTIIAVHAVVGHPIFNNYSSSPNGL